jgi:hypothetical protein
MSPLWCRDNFRVSLSLSLSLSLTHTHTHTHKFRAIRSTHTHTHNIAICVTLSIGILHLSVIGDYPGQVGSTEDSQLEVSCWYLCYPGLGFRGFPPSLWTARYLEPKVWRPVQVSLITAVLDCVLTALLNRHYYKWNESLRLRVLVRENNGVCGELFVLLSAAGRSFRGWQIALKFSSRVTVCTAPERDRQTEICTEVGVARRGEITVNREDDEFLL